MIETFTVIYRTGGTMNARWHRWLEAVLGPPLASEGQTRC